MNRTSSVLVASVGIFAGSLLSDVVLGEGIQPDDFQQAAVMGLLAAAIQWWISWRQ
jgi:hypothetical protein